jgi:hypothetical protein
MKLGHANETSVRERHGSIPIAPHQVANVAVFFAKIEIHAEKSRVNEAKEIVRFMTVTLQQEQRFRDDRFTGEHKGRRFFALLDRPGVRMIVADKESDQRTRVDDPFRHRP